MANGFFQATCGFPRCWSRGGRGWGGEAALSYQISMRLKPRNYKRILRSYTELRKNCVRMSHNYREKFWQLSQYEPRCRCFAANQNCQENPWAGIVPECEMPSWVVSTAVAQNWTKKCGVNWKITSSSPLVTPKKNLNQLVNENPKIETKTNLRSSVLELACLKAFGAAEGGFSKISFCYSFWGMTTIENMSKQLA